jgi:hypothetical protein
MANPTTRGNKFQATIWQPEDKGKYGQANLSTFNKKKDGTFENSRLSFVRFVGSGFEGFDKIVKKYDPDAKKGVKVIIKSMEITCKQYVDDSGKKVYPKNVQFVVWDWEFDEGNKKDENEEDMDTAPEVEEKEVEVVKKADPFEEDEDGEVDPFADD